MKHPIPKFLKTMAVAAVLAAVPIAAAGQGNTVVMLAKDGSTYELALSDVSRINFGAGAVELVGKSGDSKSMPYADVNRILIGGVPSGIADLIAKGEIAVYPSVTTGPLTITGADAGTEVSVYDLNGVMVCKAVATDAPLNLDLKDARPGMLIVRVGAYPVKIIKR